MEYNAPSFYIWVNHKGAGRNFLMPYACVMLNWHQLVEYEWYKRMWIHVCQIHSTFITQLKVGSNGKLGRNILCCQTKYILSTTFYYYKTCRIELFQNIYTACDFEKDILQEWMKLLIEVELQITSHYRIKIERFTTW